MEPRWENVTCLRESIEKFLLLAWSSCTSHTGNGRKGHQLVRCRVKVACIAELHRITSNSAVVRF